MKFVLWALFRVARLCGWMGGGALQVGAISLPLTRNHLQPVNPIAPRADAVPETFSVETSPVHGFPLAAEAQQVTLRP